MMKNKNIYWLIAGIWQLGVAVLHLWGGQLTLVDPLLASDLATQVQAEWLGAWHMVTLYLFSTGFYLVRMGLQPRQYHLQLAGALGWLMVLMGLPFIGASLFLGVLAPQWVLLKPVGLLTLWGNRRFLPK
ncbi:MAG: hypothetical protein AAFU60_05465 [Bacteroidota bacterium]